MSGAIPKRSRAASEFVPDNPGSQYDNRVAIYGHSQVAKLSSIENGRPIYYRGGQGRDKSFSLRYFAVPGGRVEDLFTHRHRETIKLLRPRLVFLLIGSNDVVPNTNVRGVATRIKDLALELVRDSGTEVRILELEARVKTDKNGVSPTEYNTIRKGINNLLRRRLRETRDIFFSVPINTWDLCCDGVHMDITCRHRIRQKIIDLSIRRMEVDEGFPALPLVPPPPGFQ